MAALLRQILEADLPGIGPAPAGRGLPGLRVPARDRRGRLPGRDFPVPDLGGRRDPMVKPRRPGGGSAAACLAPVLALAACFQDPAPPGRDFLPEVEIIG